MAQVVKIRTGGTSISYPGKMLHNFALLDPDSFAGRTVNNILLVGTPSTTTDAQVAGAMMCH